MKTRKRLRLCVAGILVFFMVLTGYLSAYREECDAATLKGYKTLTFYITGLESGSTLTIYGVNDKYKTQFRTPVTFESKCNGYSGGYNTVTQTMEWNPKSSDETKGTIRVTYPVEMGFNANSDFTNSKVTDSNHSGGVFLPTTIAAGNTAKIEFDHVLVNGYTPYITITAKKQLVVPGGGSSNNYYKIPYLAFQTKDNWNSTTGNKTGMDKNIGIYKPWGDGFEKADDDGNYAS